jgi:hypothetical protein
LPAVWSPSKRHALRRAFPPPAACIPNTWDRTGRPTEAAARCRVYTHATPQLPPIASLKQTFHFPLQVRKWGFHHFATRIEYDRPLWTQLLKMQPDGFAHTTPDTVPHHRLAERARRGETDPWSARLLLPHTERRKEGTRKSCPPIVNSAEIRGSQQTYTFRETRDAYLSELTVSLWRPRARRRDNTARPFFVSMRDRNPCVFARLRLLG